MLQRFLLSRVVLFFLKFSSENSKIRLATGEQMATPLTGNDLAACRFSEVNFSPPLENRRPFSFPAAVTRSILCAKRRRSLMSRSFQPFTYRVVTPVIGLFSLMNCLLVHGFERMYFRLTYVVG